MRIGIATTQVPFVRGGAEFLAESLQQALRRAGHEAEIISIPFKWYPPERIPEHMLACRLLPVDEFCNTKIDRLIGLKFPAYLMQHPNKVLWLLHQHRTAYDTWDSPLADLIKMPEGRHIRQLIRSADEALIPECRGIYTISKTVSGRLMNYNRIDSQVLYHPPPNADRFVQGGFGDYFLFPSRINDAKRQLLIVEAMSKTRLPVVVKFLGKSDAPAYLEACRHLADVNGLGDRVEWLGSISEEDKFTLYAHCRSVIFPPIDEDYGYVTLEAMAAGKAVVTCNDSGGPLEFIENGISGLICDADPEALATCLDSLWSDARMAAALGKSARALYDSLNLSWDDVIDRLLS